MEVAVKTRLKGSALKVIQQSLLRIRHLQPGPTADFFHFHSTAGCIGDVAQVRKRHENPQNMSKKRWPRWKRTRKMELNEETEEVDEV